MCGMLTPYSSSSSSSSGTPAIKLSPSHAAAVAAESSLYGTHHQGPVSYGSNHLISLGASSASGELFPGTGRWAITPTHITPRIPVLWHDLSPFPLHASPLGPDQAGDDLPLGDQHDSLLLKKPCNKVFNSLHDIVTHITVEHVGDPRSQTMPATGKTAPGK
ncbi:Zinc finger protein ZIC 1, partial [Caligus rogercresseyi]